MHRSEQETLATCADCGAELDPASERGFSFGSRGVLCAECSLRRGGEYDSATDRWVRSPALDGLEAEFD
jgi:recombinational DNA repair protein (RecF pathway)